jgi:hypothetical protein
MSSPTSQVAGLLSKLKFAPVTRAAATRSGLMRPSRVGPNNVNSASVSSARDAERVPPTCSVFFALPGADSELGGVAVAAPRLPVLKITSASGCDHAYASTSYADFG